MDANLAGDVPAWVILRVFNSVEANRAECLIIERRLLFFLHSLMDTLTTVNRVIPNLLAHDEHLSLGEHLAERLEDAHLLLVDWRELVEHNLEQPLEQTGIERAHTVYQVRQAVVLLDGDVEGHCFPDLLVSIDLNVILTCFLLFFILVVVDTTLTNLHQIIQTAKVWRQALCRRLDRTLLIRRQLRNG